MFTQAEIIKKRKKHLKELKEIANVFFKENKEIKGHHQHNWEAQVIENNIKQLKRIILNANKQLGDAELRAYATSSAAQFDQLRKIVTGEADFDIEVYMTDMVNGIERFEIHTYSPSFSIVHDLFWIPDGTIGEQHSIATGKVSPDIYEKYCPLRLEIIEKEVIPYLKKKSNYSTHLKLLNEVINSFGKSSFLFLNIVLITLAESLVRELCKFVYSKQNPGKSENEINEYIYDKFNSLETLITKADWKKDIPVKIMEAYSNSKFIIDPTLDEIALRVEGHKTAEDDIKKEVQKMSKIIEDVIVGKKQNDESVSELTRSHLTRMKELSKSIINKEEFINVSIRYRLQFLLRRYKEDRNSIIHGNYFEFDKGWKCYIYLSAITKTYEVIKEYDEIYKK